MVQHPMSEPWLDWQPIEKEPRGYEVVLYIDAGGFAWTGNHPHGFARGLWSSNGRGAADSLRRPVMWAYIPKQ